MKYTHLIVGQGLAGSLLAYNLIKENKRVAVIDNQNPVASSRVAGGLFNPITGKRLLPTWMADTLFPAADTTYRELETLLKAHFYHPTPIIRLFADTRQANEWDSKQIDPIYKNYTHNNYHFTHVERFKAAYGYTSYNKGGVLDVGSFLDAFKAWLINQGVFYNHNVDYSAIEKTPTGFKYAGIETENIIFSEGFRAHNNPWFFWLPFVPSKGDVFTIKIGGPAIQEIVSRGVFIRPVEESTYRVGSTYIWDDQTEKPTKVGFKTLKAKLDELLNVPYTILDHKASVRPTVRDRRPFLGAHPEQENIYIFNGLGTKGVLLAPWFATHFSEFLIYGKPILPDVNIERFVNKFYPKA